MIKIIDYLTIFANNQIIKERDKNKWRFSSDD